MSTSGRVAGGAVDRTPPSSFWLSVRGFQVAVVVPALALIAYGLASGGVGYLDDPSRLLEVLFWIALIGLLELLPIPVWKSLQVGTGFPLFTAVAFLYPPAVAGAIVFLGSLDPREFRRQVRPLTALFNRSQLAIAESAASYVFHSLGGTLEAWSAHLLLVVPTAVLVFYICNVVLVSSGLALEHGIPLISVMRKMRIGNPIEFFVSYLGLGGLGVMVGELYLLVGWWAVAGFVMPLLLARQMFVRTRALENATQELQDREVVLRALSNRMAEERQDERKAIAGYLHDDLAQVLYRMALHLDVSEKQLEKGEPEKARKEMAALRESRNRAMELIRALIRDLHRSPLGRAGLSESLTSYAQEVERDTGVRVRTHLEDIEMAPPVQLLCYHVAREAVMNAIKHAEPSWIDVKLQPTPDGARLTVDDDGKGFDVEAGSPEGHFGLTMMRERAQVAGGTFTIESQTGRGTTVIADFPTSWMVEADGQAGRAAEQAARDSQA